MSRPVYALCLAALLAAVTSAGAQEPQHPHAAPPPAPHAVPPPAPHAAPPPQMAHVQHLDTRYNHGHYYPPAGATVHVPPPAPVIVTHGSGRYYYSGGVWYAPRGPNYVVVAAPVGVFIPVLPPYYTTVWVSGAPYYYANDTYYTWQPQQNGYEVVAPPADGQDVSTDVPPPVNDDLFVYPQNGQNDQQQSTDRYECHQWATSQTGFDPTQAGGAPAAGQPAGNPDDYQRAMKACLEGRGYSVR